MGVIEIAGEDINAGGVTVIFGISDVASITLGETFGTTVSGRGAFVSVGGSGGRVVEVGSLDDTVRAA